MGNQKISAMKRETTAMKERAKTLEDCDARLKEQLERDSAAMMADADAYTKEEENKARAALPEPKACEICGTGYKNDEDYKKHLEYRVHSAYEEVQKKFDELKAGKAERAKRKAEAASDERKKSIEDSANDEKKSSRKDGDG